VVGNIFSPVGESIFPGAGTFSPVGENMVPYFKERSGFGEGMFTRVGMPSPPKGCPVSAGGGAR
jgi:hypothetical protein